MKTVGELRTALEGLSDADELVLNIDTRRITIDPAEVKRVEVDQEAERKVAHLMIGDW